MNDVARAGVFDLSGVVAIVTGGGTGIGRAAATVLAEWGARVVVGGRTRAALDRVVAEITDAGNTAVPVVVDVTDPADRDRLVAETIGTFGGLDVLVNNAGGSRGRRDAEWSAEDWDRMIELNLSSVWYLSRAAAAVMVEAKGGAIINVGSAAGLTPRPLHSPYGVAKAGVVHLTSVLAAEYGPLGIRVNCVAPGLIRTDGFVRAMRKLGRDPDDQGGRVLVGRPGDPREIAYPILFLASRAASYVHGETLYVGGGPRYWSEQ